MVLSKGLRWLATVSSLMRLLTMMPGMLLGFQKIGWLLEASKLKQGVNSSCISPESWQSKDILVIVIDTTHHKLGIDCDNALVTNLVPTRVRYTYDWTPEYAVRLPSGLTTSLSCCDMATSMSTRSPIWERLALALAGRKCSDSALGFSVVGTNSQKRGVSGYILKW